MKHGIVVILVIFLCGFFVGEMVGSALSAFQIVHQREPTADEHLEIIELVESHAKEIKEFLPNLTKDFLILVYYA